MSVLKNVNVVYSVPYNSEDYASIENDCSGVCSFQLIDFPTGYLSLASLRNLRALLDKAIRDGGKKGTPEYCKD